MNAIPESKRAAVERALRETFGITTAESVSLLTGGLSSALVYRIGVGGSSYVLRLVMRVDALTDPVRQYHCMRLAADAGIAPRVWYADAADAVSITDFIDTSTAGEPPSRPERLRLLAETIHAIQALPLFPALVNYLDGVDDFIARFQQSAVLPVSATEEHFRYYARLQAAYPRHDPALVSSHNDLNPNNLLFDGKRFWVVDWETAFRNDRYADLANAAVFMILDAAEEEAFLRAYFGGSLSDYHRARFFLMRQVCRMFYAMCFLFLAPAQSPPGTVFDPEMRTPCQSDFYAQLATGAVDLGAADGQVLFGKVLLGEMLRDLRSPRFEQVLRLVE